MTKEEKIAKIYLGYKANLPAFARLFCSDLCTSDIPEFHKEIYKLIYETDRLLIAAPRGFAKSSIVARIGVLHKALFKDKRDIIIISASESLAIEHIRWIKQKIENDQNIKDLWGNLRSDKWTETHITIKHQDGTLVNIRAKGAEAQIRGFRPDCIILDDIETDETVESEDSRKKIKGWLFKACINSLKVGGQFIMIGTLIHPLAVIADLFAVPNKWVKRKWRAYRTAEEKEGNELWASLWSHARLQTRKAEITSQAWASEYLNEPSLDVNAPIKEEDIRYWEDLPKQYSCVLSVDPAYSEDESADYKVATLVASDVAGNRYLLEYIRSHDSSLDYIDAILSMYQRNSQYITALGCPHSGGDREFFNSLMRVAEERKIYPPFVELKNTFVTASGRKITNKNARVKAALQPLFQNGRYYIHANHLEVRDELLSIGVSLHDDLVDCLAYAETLIPNNGQYFETQDDKEYVEPPSIEGYGMDY
jgi:hypothetical protein